MTREQAVVQFRDELNGIIAAMVTFGPTEHVPLAKRLRQSFDRIEAIVGAIFDAGELSVKPKPVVPIANGKPAPIQQYAPRT